MFRKFKNFKLKNTLYIGLVVLGLLTSMFVISTVSVAKIPPQDNISTTNVNSLAFDQSGKHLASARDDGGVSIWDINTGNNTVLTSNSSAPITGLAFSPDGRILVASSRDSKIKLWDTSSNKIIKELHGTGEAGWILAVAYSPDGKTIATAGADTNILLWNTSSMSIKNVLAGHKGFVRSVSFSSDGKSLASSSDDGSVKIWDVDSGHLLKSIDIDNGSVTTVVFSPNVNNIAMGNSNGYVSELNASTGQLVRTYTGKGTRINGLSYSPDNVMLTAVGDDGTINTWRISDGMLIAKKTQGPNVGTRSVAYNPNSQIVATGGTDGVIKLWDTKTWKEISSLTEPAKKLVIPKISQNVSQEVAKGVVATPFQIPAAPGGPILIITSSGSSNPFGIYYTEILRNEGFNAFQVADISSVTSTTLSNYNLVILAEATLNPSQVTMFSNWVNSGGRLIAMRPDSQLSGLLGITGPSSTMVGAYMLVNTTGAPGKGIVNQTMQYQGTADIYNLNGATTVATLYKDANTSTVNPAVVINNVGSGRIAAFTYDLARSIIYMRQGNPSWGMERDGFPPIRSDDWYYGNASFDPEPDWVDLNKVAIPQADEQQRFLANMILEMTKDIKPFPRFWYLPRGIKAVVVMSGDDHANGGTAGRFDQYIADSPTNCNVANWQCVRSTSYVEPGGPLTNQQALSYQNKGFEVSIHIDSNCQDYDTQSNLESLYTSQLAQWQKQYSSITLPQTHRMHCVVWDGWNIQPTVELNHGIRFDATYYFWPPTWVNDRPGFFTGSGWPMRLSDLNGNIMDNYEAETQMTDESGQSYPFTSDTLLDRAIGPEEYFGVFTVNAHTDVAYSDVSDAIVASAQSRNIPIVSSRQMLDWLDGRDSSTYNNLVWNGANLSFSITQNSKANGLQVMVPAASTAGSVIGINVNGNPTNYVIKTINGISYAFVNAITGTYSVTYGRIIPTINGNTPANGSTGVKTSTGLTVTFNEPMDSSTINTGTFELQTPDGATVPAVVTYNDSSFVATLKPLSPLVSVTQYTAIVKGGATGVKDLGGNTMIADYTWSFTTTSGPVCPCSVWNSTNKPVTVSDTDTSATELGLRFRSDSNGYITGIRFYKGSTNTGTHVGSLWTNTGTLLGRVTFSGESTSGWQQANFTTPVPITAGTTYVASYHTNVGHYSEDDNYFASSGVDNAPLHALQNGIDGYNGVYTYSSSSAFPSSTWSSANYWVDVVFNYSPPQTIPTITGNTPISGATGISISTPVTATFSEAMNSSTINTSTFELHQGNATGSLVPATVSYNTNTFVATLTPINQLANNTMYTAIVRGGNTDPRVKDISGNSMMANYNWSFTTSSGSTVITSSIWSSTATPGIIAENDASALELGVKFRTDVNGSITGIRFYKSSSNTGTHVGTIWSNTGVQLGRVTFSGESASGWQQANFTTPVNVTAGTTYVASYHTNVGYYSEDDNYFANSGVDNPPLHALQDGVDGGDGVYVYNANPTFPTSTWSSANYWVDLVFKAR